MWPGISHHMLQTAASSTGKLEKILPEFSFRSRTANFMPCWVHVDQGFLMFKSAADVYLSQPPLAVDDVFFAQ